MKESTVLEGTAVWDIKLGSWFAFWIGAVEIVWEMTEESIIDGSVISNFEVLRTAVDGWLKSGSFWTFLLGSLPSLKKDWTVWVELLTLRLDSIVTKLDCIEDELKNDGVIKIDSDLVELES